MAITAYGAYGSSLWQKSRIQPGPGAVEFRTLNGMAMGKRPAARQASRAHSRFPGHALTPTGVMAIRCKQFHLPDL